jgi:septal ring factor EnvC (AmiA/AmiB activator)
MILRSVPLILCFALAAQTAAAQNSVDDKSRSELEEIEKKLEERQREERRLKNEVGARDREVKALRLRMIETANALQDAEKRIADINVETARLESEERDLLVTLRKRKSDLGDVLGALQSLERARPPALLVAPEDAASAARIALLLADAAPDLEAKAAEVGDALERLKKVRLALDEERANFEKTNEEVEDRRRVLAALLKTKQDERDVARRLAAAAQGETAALAARALTLREVLGRLERLARSVTPRLKPPPPTQDAPASPTPAARSTVRGPSLKFIPSRPFASAKGALRPPVVGDITGRFGAVRPEGGKFEGVRFAAAADAIVTAPYEGNIVFARPWDRVGNLMVMDVGGGYHILLIGVGAFLVEEGQNVAAGEPIGVMSGNGTETLADLDLEVRKDREPVNPLLWLSGKIGG